MPGRKRPEVKLPIQLARALAGVEAALLEPTFITARRPDLTKIMGQQLSVGDPGSFDQWVREPCT